MENDQYLIRVQRELLLIIPLNFGDRQNSSSYPQVMNEHRRLMGSPYATQQVHESWVHWTPDSHCSHNFSNASQSQDLPPLWQWSPDTKSASPGNLSDMSTFESQDEWIRGLGLWYKLKFKSLLLYGIIIYLLIKHLRWSDPEHELTPPSLWPNTLCDGYLMTIELWSGLYPWMPIRII